MKSIKECCGSGTTVYPWRTSSTTAIRERFRLVGGRRSVMKFETRFWKSFLSSRSSMRLSVRTGRNLKTTWKTKREGEYGHQSQHTSNLLRPPSLYVIN